MLLEVLLKVLYLSSKTVFKELLEVLWLSVIVFIHGFTVVFSGICHGFEFVFCRLYMGWLTPPPPCW